ncbi:ABC transporter ATP-binding protein [Halioglobus maricola]|uniref:ABC transporter ATP-binding protein n=1 Tax=Halioglobus maricola TaxID=2601894 RepID=A0A5P9NFN6_9GAMM|nr:ABC transporter ATP-binding protein [Halioglobus maricola]QFU74597.1 ABC transporter ATP-binding protein [Halioglobus maricola]
MNHRPANNFRSLTRYLTPPWRVLLWSVVLLLASSLLMLAQPWLAGQLTAIMLTPDATNWSAGHLMMLWLVLLVLRNGLGFATQYYIGSAGENMTAQLRSRLFQHLQALPLSYHQQRRRGDLLAILSNDAEYISGFVTDTLVQLLPMLLTLGGACLMMLVLDPLVASLAIILLPPYFLLMKIVGRRLRPISRAWIDAYSNLFTYIDEHLAMLPAIKSFTREPTELDRFQSENAQLLRLSKKQLLIESLLGPAVSLMTGLGLLLLLWLGYSQVNAGELEAAQLVSLLLYAVLLTTPLRGLADVYGQVQRTRGAAERILDFLGEQPEPDDSGAQDLPAVRGEIRFTDVGFQYPGGKPVLRGFNLHVEAGETLALIGANGAGKSTVAHLMMRMADPDSGAISIDGVDLSTVSLKSLRTQIGLVAQHTLLLNATVADNIGYGSPVASQQAIEAAAIKANAHNFITALPQGYDTVIGDQGVRLSGGQRQRLALARTLLTDPPILILDEATSMYDPEGESEFIRECTEVLQGKTVILITHRESTLVLADRVVRLEKL